MKGDYSCKTFEPRSNYAGVRMQQGRVQLDADWNEQVDIRDRRVRAQTVDLHGRCLCSEQTPDAFLLDNDAGALTIAPGRLYVDGLLADNHGNAPIVFDEVLAEQRGTTAVPYLSQQTIIDGITPIFGAGLATILCMVLHVVTFLVKVIVMIWFQMLIRWSLPRFRYDQVMDLCWKVILPLSLVNIFATALIMLLVGSA